MELRERRSVVQRLALGRDLEREDVVGLVSQLHAAQLHEASRQETGGDQQHQR